MGRGGNIRGQHRSLAKHTGGYKRNTVKEKCTIHTMPHHVEWCESQKRHAVQRGVEVTAGAAPPKGTCSAARESRILISAGRQH